ncbi:MAG: DUF3592 domain-containing protein [Anaerolineales bacterium]
MNSNNLIVLIAVICSGILFNVLLIVFIVLPYRKASQARNWLQTTGTVETSEIVHRSDSDGGTSPYPHVVYTYQANGQSLKNDRIQPGGDVGGMVAYKTQKKYLVGARVPVYYNPQNPSEALLERSVPGYVRWLWVALVFVNLTICCCGILPMISTPLFGGGIKLGLPYLFKFISEQLKP